MNVSSVSSSFAQMQSIQTPVKVPEKVEGNMPDGDSDRDDAVQAASAAQANNTPESSGALGTQINVTA